MSIQKKLNKETAKQTWRGIHEDINENEKHKPVGF